MRSSKIFLLAATALLLPGTLLAYDLGDIRINGFVAQGYLNSTENNFLSDSKDGTTQFNEVGLTLNTQVNDKLRVGAQLLSRDLGDAGNNEVRLDWAFGDYRFKDYLGLRIGKVKTPMGLYNEGRDSDFMRPMIFLPQSIYDEGNRDLFVAYQGAGLYGNVAAGPVGDFDYHIFYGVVNFPDDALMQRGFLVVAQQINPAATAADAENKYLSGGSIFYNTPISGLRLGVSQMQGKADIAITSGGVVIGEGKTRMKNRWTYSLEYATSYFTFASEYSEYELPVEAFGIKSPTGTSQAWYAMLTVPVTDSLSVSGLYDVFYDDKDDRDGAKYAAMGLDFLGWRKDLGVGVRYDVNPSWTLKGEYHYINGNLPTAIIFNDPATMEKTWDYYAVKASFNF